LDLNSRWRIPLVTTEKCKLRHAGSGLSRLPLTKKWNWNSAGTCSWSTDWWMEPWPPATKRVEVLHLFRWFTHTHEVFPNCYSIVLAYSALWYHDYLSHKMHGFLCFFLFFPGQLRFHRRLHQSPPVSTILLARSTSSIVDSDGHLLRGHVMV